MSYVCLHCGERHETWLSMRTHYVTDHPDLRHPPMFKTRNAAEMS